MQDLDIALLRTFVTLAETASFSRTGDLIGRSQSAVSGQVARLEAVLGCRLVARDTRNVALTADGERLLGQARSMIADTDALMARFRGPEVAGAVRFGAPEDFASVYLADILGAFAASHPAVELHVTCQLTLPLVDAFNDGQLDLIVVKHDPARPYPGARPIWQEDLVWVGAHDTAFSTQNPVALVVSPAPCVYRARATQALDAAGVAWRGVFTSPSFAGSVAGVRAGLGVAVMPRAMVPQGLCVLAQGWPVLAAAEIAMLGAARQTAATQALAAFIVERVRR